MVVLKCTWSLFESGMVRHTDTNDCHKERVLYSQICGNMRLSTAGHAGPHRKQDESGGREGRAEHGQSLCCFFFLVVGRGGGGGGMNEAGKVH